MPTTPNLALPYPSASDPADVPTDMGELADRIDDLAGAADGLATLDSTGKVPASQLPSGGGGPVALDDLTDVTTAGVADDEVLTYDAATFTWQPAPGGGGAVILDDLTDVTTAGAADGDLLGYDSASLTWQPVTGAGGGGDPAADTRVWMPLFDSDGTLVLDSDEGLIPTLIPLA